MTLAGEARSREEADAVRAIVDSLVDERRELVRRRADRQTLEANRRALGYWCERLRESRRRR